MTHGGHEDGPGHGLGSNLNPGDVAGLLQPHVRPRLTAVQGFVDAVPPGGALAVLGLSRPHPDDVGRTLNQRHVSDGGVGLIVEEGLEAHSMVRGPPQASCGRSDVEGRGIRLVHGEVADSPTHHGRPDGAVFQGFQGGLIDLGAGFRRQAEEASEEEGQEDEGSIPRAG